MRLSVTLHTAGFTMTNPPPPEGAPLLLRWACGCTTTARWATGLTITHDLPAHHTDYTIRPPRHRQE